MVRIGGWLGWPPNSASGPYPQYDNSGTVRTLRHRALGQTEFHSRFEDVESVNRVLAKLDELAGQFPPTRRGGRRAARWTPSPRAPGDDAGASARSPALFSRSAVGIPGGAHGRGVVPAPAVHHPDFSGVAPHCSPGKRAAAPGRRAVRRRGTSEIPESPGRPSAGPGSHHPPGAGRERSEQHKDSVTVCTAAADGAS